MPTKVLINSQKQVLVSATSTPMTKSSMEYIKLFNPESKPQLQHVLYIQYLIQVG